jgi:NAD(P)-dependent dehydrogenase (short-subunit alcohol dehydrogenase family)
MDFISRVVLLTGARRIGADIARAVAARGADVAVAYRQSADEANGLVADIKKSGRRALSVQADVTDSSSAESLVNQVVASLGRLDVLVNMASLYQQVPIDRLDANAWRRQLAVDLDGSFFCARAAIAHLRRAGGGRIINFCDWVAASGRPRYTGYTAYYVAKAGVKALTESLALELASDNILVNAIAPGPILAPPDLSDEDAESVEKATPLGRWGGPEEIVKVALSLIESDFITGETIRVDGGRHLK